MLWGKYMNNHIYVHNKRSFLTPNTSLLHELSKKDFVYWLAIFSKMPSLLYGPWIHLLQVQKIIQHFCLLHINALTKHLVMPCILKEEKTAINNCKTVESRAHCQQRFSIGLRISAQMLNLLAPHKYKLSQQISFFVSQCDFS